MINIYYHYLIFFVSEQIIIIDNDSVQKGYLLDNGFICKQEEIKTVCKI